jgi:hypothetical protein
LTQSCDYKQLDKLTGRVGGRQLFWYHIKNVCRGRAVTEDYKQNCRQGVRQAESQKLVVWWNIFREELSEKKCRQGLRQADILERRGMSFRREMTSRTAGRV